MADYSHLAALAVTSETLAEYTFSLIPGEPSIMFAPATDDNRAYLNERLRLSLERAEKAEREPKVKRPRGITAEDIEDAREVDRVLLSRCCAKAWGVAPLTSDGQTPDFSEAECYDFFKALPDWLFDPLRNWAGNPANFVSRPALAKLADMVGNGSPKA